MIANILSKVATVLAVSALTILLFKWFGQEFGVEVKADGLASEAAYPMAIFSAVLAGFARSLQSRLDTERATNA